MATYCGQHPRFLTSTLLPTTTCNLTGLGRLLLRKSAWLTTCVALFWPTPPLAGPATRRPLKLRPGASNRLTKTLDREMDHGTDHGTGDPGSIVTDLNAPALPRPDVADLVEFWPGRFVCYGARQLFFALACVGCNIKWLPTGDSLTATQGALQR